MRATSPQPGTYSYPEGTTYTLIATPNSGFEFQYWLISGSYTSTNYQAPKLVPPVQAEQGYIPTFPEPTSAVLDTNATYSLTLYDSRLDVDCGYASIFTYQPVFAPIQVGQEGNAVVIIPSAVYKGPLLMAGCNNLYLPD